jgi:hypothetical protein
MSLKIPHFATRFTNERIQSYCIFSFVNSTMAAIALAILGKRNEPLYLREFHSDHHEPAISEEELFGLEPSADEQPSQHEECSVKQQFILHAALDRFDQIIAGGQWRKQGVAGTDAMFVGLLCPVEDMRVYGECVMPFV